MFVLGAERQKKKEILINELERATINENSDGNNGVEREKCILNLKDLGKKECGDCQKQ